MTTTAPADYQHTAPAGYQQHTAPPAFPWEPTTPKRGRYVRRMRAVAACIASAAIAGTVAAAMTSAAHSANVPTPTTTTTAPAACLEALTLGEQIVGNHAEVLEALQGLPDMVTEAARAGLVRDAATMSDIARRMDVMTGEVTRLGDEAEVLEGKYLVAEARCRA